MNSDQWMKAASSHGDGNCVEVTTSLDRVRDSKDPHGPQLSVSVRNFVEAIKTGRFDR